MRASVALVLILAGSILSTGCTTGKNKATSDRATTGAFDPTIPWPDVTARVAPPEGWRADPYKASSRHAHQVWVSPSGKTAYGVIRFSLPLPVGPDLCVWAFLREMRKTEGSAELLEQKDDPTLPGVRFIAKGGKYTVRTNLKTRGFKGWAVYAGTLTNSEINEEELKLAEQAREATRVGM